MNPEIRKHLASFYEQIAVKVSGAPLKEFFAEIFEKDSKGVFKLDLDLVQSDFSIYWWFGHAISKRGHKLKIRCDWESIFQLRDLYPDKFLEFIMEIKENDIHFEMGIFKFILEKPKNLTNLINKLKNFDEGHIIFEKLSYIDHELEIKIEKLSYTKFMDIYFPETNIKIINALGKFKEADLEKFRSVYPEVYASSNRIIEDLIALIAGVDTDTVIYKGIIFPSKYLESKFKDQIANVLKAYFANNSIDLEVA